MKTHLHSALAAGSPDGLREPPAGCTAEAQMHLDFLDQEELAALLERQVAQTRTPADATQWLARIEMLEPGVLAARPWLQYWLGRCVGWSDPPRARESLAAAARAFAVADDESGLVLANCALVELDLYSWGECAGLGEAAAGLLEAPSTAASREAGGATALLAHATAAAGLAAANPLHPLIAKASYRAAHLLARVPEPGQRLRAAAKLLQCTPWLPAGLPLALTVEYDPLALSGDCSVFARIEWCCAASRWHLEYSGNLGAAQALLDEGERLAAGGGWQRAGLRLLHIRAALYLAQDRLQQAASIVTGIAAQPPAGDRFEKEQIGILQAQLLLASGDHQLGLAMAQAVCGSRKVLGARPLERARFERATAALCAQSGHHDDAQEWIRRALGSATGSEIPLTEDAWSLLDAAAEAGRGLAAGAARKLRDVLPRHRARFLNALFPGAPRLAGQLAELALEAGAQADHIATIIVAQHLRPSTRTCAHWPWPVAIRVLGAFSLSLAGTPVSSTGKAQQRLIEFLRILVVAGAAGRSQQSLEVQLWSDSENPRSALAVAVHRLRKFLGHEAAVLIDRGRVTLSRDVVWTDVEALSGLSAEIDDSLPGALPARVERLADRLLELYRGELCEGDEDPWMVSARNRIRTHFTTSADALGQCLERQGAWDGARKLYRRVLDAEPLSETAYRGLMRSANASGDSAAAFSFYRFCRDTLSIVLNRPPSPETRHLAASLGLIEQAA